MYKLLKEPPPGVLELPAFRNPKPKNDYPTHPISTALSTAELLFITSILR